MLKAAKMLLAKKIESLIAGCFRLWAENKHMFTRCAAGSAFYQHGFSLYASSCQAHVPVHTNEKRSRKGQRGFVWQTVETCSPAGWDPVVLRPETGRERDREEKSKRERDWEREVEPRQAALTLFTTKSYCLMWPRGPRPPTRSHRMCCGWDATWLTSTHRGSPRQTLFLTALASPPHRAAHSNPPDGENKDSIVSRPKEPKDSPLFPFIRSLA